MARRRSSMLTLNRHDPRRLVSRRLCPLPNREGILSPANPFTPGRGEAGGAYLWMENCPVSACFTRGRGMNFFRYAGCSCPMSAGVASGNFACVLPIVSARMLRPYDSGIGIVQTRIDFCYISAGKASGKGVSARPRVSARMLRPYGWVWSHIMSGGQITHARLVS